MNHNFSEIKRQRAGSCVPETIGSRDPMKPSLAQFEDLDAWRVARELTAEIYVLCRREPLVRDFGLCDQLRRAAVSVMNNISEGWESRHHAEKLQFYNFARRSCGEVRSMSYVLLDSGFVGESEQRQLRDHCIRSGMLISGMIRSAENRN